jgi:hypothetical protein
LDSNCFNTEDTEEHREEIGERKVFLTARTRRNRESR